MSGTKRGTKIGTGDVSRFDQKYNIYSRLSWDPKLKDLSELHNGPHKGYAEDGYTLEDWAACQAAWYVERAFGKGSVGIGDFGLFQWEPEQDQFYKISRLAPGQKHTINNPLEMSHHIKRMAKFLGASSVGICKVDERWIYSHRFHRETLEYSPFDIPVEFQNAIVMAHEMDYELIKSSPTYLSQAAVGDAYSAMPYVAGRLAHFIRILGYKAIPSGNDTALSVPFAIDAGLGELGRNGLLITYKFGPRVRLSKVFTNLPLVPDKPIEFGVSKFCETCGLCAEKCPGRAINDGEPTYEGPNVSSSHGIYKWYTDGEKCEAFWMKKNRGNSCANCIRVCPFNKPEGWLHTTAKFMVKNLPHLNRQMLWADKLCGYGSKTKAKDYWRKDA